MSNLEGTTEVNLVKTHSKLHFIYSAMTALESYIVEELYLFFNMLEQEGHYEPTNKPILSAVYGKVTEPQHCILVEVGLQSTTTESISKDGRLNSIKVGDVYREFQEKTGLWNFQINFYVRSTTRSSVAILADALYIGLQTNLYNRLSTRNIHISFNKIRISTTITPRKIAGDVQVYELNFNIADVSVPWLLITEINGDIMKGFSLEAIEDLPLEQSTLEVSTNG